MSAGRSSRRKGHDREREVVRRFNAIPGVHVARVLRETRDGNCGDVRGDVPLSIQVKVGAAPSAWAALEEATEAAEPGDFAVALVKRNRSGARGPQSVAIMSEEDFFEVVGLLKAGGVW